MIKISLHLSFSGHDKPDLYLEIQAQEYWESMNPMVAGIYTPASLISRIRVFRDRAKNLDPSYVDEFADSDPAKSLIHADFFSLILDNSENLLKEIIVSEPSKLDYIKDLIRKAFPDNIFNATTGTPKGQTAFGKLLSENIFNYKKFRASQACLDYLQSLAFNQVYCPYCGYDELKLVGVSPGDTIDPEKALLDLDHFFSKSDFPYFAISLFNLVPCCHTCNSSYKLKKKFSLSTHIHPFEESFDDHFLFWIKSTQAGPRVAVVGIESSTKSASVSDLGINKRYEQTRILFELETDYRAFDAYKRRGAEDDFVKYMLKGVPRTKFEILYFPMGKAKRDILWIIDEHNVLRPHLN